jgi:hypothetical protein
MSNSDPPPALDDAAAAGGGEVAFEGEGAESKRLMISVAALR